MAPEATDLYYANLGIEDSEKVKDRVTMRLNEFRDYLKRAAEQMEKRSYTFSFKIDRIIGLLESVDPSSTRNPFASYEFFYDADCRKKIPADTIDRDRREIWVRLSEVPEFVYGKFKGSCHKFQFIRHKSILNDLRSLGIPEDEEDNAFELLTEISDISLGENPGNKSSRYRKISYNVRTGKLFIEGVPNGDKFRIKYNTYIIFRQKEAVELLAMRPLSHHLPLLNLMRRIQDFSWGEVDLHKEPEKYYVLTDESRDGNKEQREFVKKALGSPDFSILEGPPGSGKTTTILEAVAQEISKDKKVLVAASTHVAVDNILERLETTYVDTSNGRKTLLDECGIIPIRIGDEGAVSEQIQKYCLHRCVETERARLINHFRKIKEKKKLSTAQERFYRDISQNEKEGRIILESLLLDCANLICGTTIGVLQAPIIKKSLLANPIFDLVIIDEASKTTFQEFLVPALFGRKWILSGDVKQLSPYVDQLPILANLSTLRGFSKDDGDEDRELCLKCFLAVSGFGKIGRSVLIPCGDKENVPLYTSLIREQMIGLQDRAGELEAPMPEWSVIGIDKKPTTDGERLKISGSNLIVVYTDLIPEIEGLFSPDIVGSDDLLSSKYLREQKACGIRSLSETKCWEEEVAWRLTRMHENVQNLKKFGKLSNEVELLIPHFERENRKGDSERKRSRDEIVRTDISRIRRISIPSVLELLQTGFEQDRQRYDHDDIALYAGLSYGGEKEEVLSSRHTLLTHQQRMHPDISEIPRNLVYENKALFDARVGKKTMADRRAWSYDAVSGYSRRSVWIDEIPRKPDDLGTGKSRYNLSEVRRVVKEFKKFITWAKDHPNPDNKWGIWSVAFLSFYKGQTKRLMEELVPFSGKKGLYSGFQIKDHNVSADICSVDKFQGHEADIVFLSFVNSRGRIGFLDNPNRLNVGITRALYQLVMIGDKRNFMYCDSDLLKSLANSTPSNEISWRD